MIITNNEDALRIKCEDATKEEVGHIIEQLESELANSARLGFPGIGLASSQVGIAKNVAIVRLNDTFNVNLVNCRIEKQYDPMIFRGEGCLSFPGRIEDTRRYQEIVVVDNLVYPYSFIATGLFSIVIQHELDHLSGILLPDIAIPKIINKKPRPNDPCPCGKQLKYKRCCGKTNI
jgi:peptide deformylase